MKSTTTAGTGAQMGESYWPQPPESPATSRQTGFLGPGRIRSQYGDTEGKAMIVITIGRHAATIAEQMAVGQQNAATKNAPLWLMDVPMSDDLTRTLTKVRLRLTTLCADVARFMATTADQTAYLDEWRNGEGEELGQQNGPVYRQPPSAQEGALPAVWLLLSVSAPTAAEHNVYRLQVLAHAQQTLRLLDAVAWQQWRTDIMPKGILLVAQRDQHAPAECRQQVSGMINEPLYLVGYRDQALGEVAEQARVAQTIGAILALPMLHTQRQAGTETDALWAIGAASWQPAVAT